MTNTESQGAGEVYYARNTDIYADQYPVQQLIPVGPAYSIDGFIEHANQQARELSSLREIIEDKNRLIDDYETELKAHDLFPSALTSPGEVKADPHIHWLIYTDFTPGCEHDWHPIKSTKDACSKCKAQRKAPEEVNQHEPSA